MAQFPSGHDGFGGGEQSWIVLDDQGWSRPPTASPSRQLTMSRQEVMKTISSDDESDDDGGPRFRRLGMDRDVRAALELAERSLELAGSAEEFANRLGNEYEEDHDDIIRDSPMMNYVGQVAFEQHSVAQSMKVDDPYQGRNPPFIRRSSPFEVTVASGAQSTPPVSLTPPVFACPSPSQVRVPPSPRGKRAEASKESETSFLHWFFGLSSNASPIPVILSHLLTLAAGYYLGTRRACSLLPPPPAHGPPSAQNANQ